MNACIFFCRYFELCIAEMSIFLSLMYCHMFGMSYDECMFVLCLFVWFYGETEGKCPH